jgi:hypothetical protein
MTQVEYLSDTTPQIDDSKIGLSLVAVVYAIVLGQVFLEVVKYNKLLGVSWSKLALATTAIVLSYIGFYNNRDEYPVWKARFINVPFLQYLLSIATLAGYWGMVIGAVGSDKHSARPDVLLVAMIFTVYLLWDILQMASQWFPKYIAATALRVSYDKLNAHDIGCTTYAPINLMARTVARLGVTVVFTIASWFLWHLIWYRNPSSTRGIVTIEILYCMLLLTYRLMQQFAAWQAGPPKVILPQVT